MVTFQDFQKLDIRIGTVIKAEIPEWSHWVMKLTVDFGEPPDGLGTKTIFAGFMHFFTPSELEGNQYPFIVNLEPKKIGPLGDFSEGMILATDKLLDQSLKIEGIDEEITSKPALFTLSEKVKNGAKIH
ncbi:hypothetical protein A2382_02700 [Candidatus Woesebacteria bacterium RIFOXYB1_FULL_38_16]|uniref:tRNA-binding domain-containing protein n=1 Tax=Candidatus Woesebacteria bacterium RIFOXYB1_FULL_38_16 TaxID=1802538 RepID=A0A1F8CS92_9BACT|nr:MAG: hypothetical protein A2191_03840 [Candidatus Woesebacteria bacterium RIFOXYA1_FULL_38_9]OGM79121.1 MAG: hypothetical protein A2382_02700 [Candidatus Woesebacteria bacterium RIFOXYB1_FULL_38_16]